MALERRGELDSHMMVSSDSTPRRSERRSHALLVPYNLCGSAAYDPAMLLHGTQIPLQQQRPSKLSTQLRRYYGTRLSPSRLASALEIFQPRPLTLALRTHRETFHPVQNSRIC